MVMQDFRRIALAHELLAPCPSGRPAVPPGTDAALPSLPDQRLLPAPPDPPLVPLPAPVMAADPRDMV
ncbi:MAG: hypothetical protein ACREFY_07750 [Acetobacteraceae bacterium]